MKKLFVIVLIIILIVSNVVIGKIAYRNGVEYGMNETAKVYFEGFSESVNRLEIGELSQEFTMNGNDVGIDETLNFRIVRTK